MKKQKKMSFNKKELDLWFDAAAIYIEDLIKHPEKIRRIKNNSTITLVPVPIPKKKAA